MHASLGNIVRPGSFETKESQLRKALIGTPVGKSEGRILDWCRRDKFTVGSAIAKQLYNNAI